jgi:oligosaccharide 4-alpha-D-glucosyltransferase
MKNYKIFFLLLFISVFSFAQNSKRIFKSAKLQKDTILKIEVNDGMYQIKFYSNKIIETSFIPTNETFSRASHAVVLNPASLKTKFKETKNEVFFSADDLKLIFIKTNS